MTVVTRTPRGCGSGTGGTAFADVGIRHGEQWDPGQQGGAAAWRKKSRERGEMIAPIEHQSAGIHNAATPGHSVTPHPHSPAVLTSASIVSNNRVDHPPDHRGEGTGDLAPLPRSEGTPAVTTTKRTPAARRRWTRVWVWTET